MLSVQARWGRRAGRSEHLIQRVSDSMSSKRLGAIVVPLSVARGAVVRNRIRRRIRSAVRALGYRERRLPARLIASREAATVPFLQLVHDIREALRGQS